MPMSLSWGLPTAFQVGSDMVNQMKNFFKKNLYSLHTMRLRKWCASETHAGPMPMSLTWAVPNSLSGWVCCCASKEKILKTVHSSNDETMKGCDLTTKKNQADS
jgi:hypothetical protein